MSAWLEDAAARLLEAYPEAGELALTSDEVDLLLELARVAAHDSGQRINAPLLTYLAGIVAARSGASLEDIADTALGRTPE
jgi:hypothetical protein